MMKNRILWILWLLCMALAAVFTGSWIFAAVLLTFFIVAAGSLILGAFCGKKTTASFFSSKGSRAGQYFQRKTDSEKSVGSAGISWKGIYFLEKQLYRGGRENSFFFFSWQQRKKRKIEFQAVSSWCGCINFLGGRMEMQ